MSHLFSPFNSAECLAEVPPLNNMGGKFLPVVYAPDLALSVVSEGAAFVDALSFVFKVDRYKEEFPSSSSGAFLEHLGRMLVFMFGFDVTSQRPTGLNFYESSYYLGAGGKCGLLSLGGDRQRGTVLVQIYGYGCSMAKLGWEERCHAFLSDVGGYITRADCAYDDYNGVYNVDSAFSDYDKGAYSTRGRYPNVEQRGNWVRPNGKGRTLYIGERSSGKLLRVYEKGLQLGSLDKPTWNRIELELHNSDRVIPLDVLLRPSAYLSGAYPALSFISPTAERIRTIKLMAKASISSAIANIKKQWGKYIYFLRNYYDDDNSFFSDISRLGIPHCFLPAFSHANNGLS